MGTKVVVGVPLDIANHEQIPEVDPGQGVGTSGLAVTPLGVQGDGATPSTVAGLPGVLADPQVADTLTDGVDELVIGAWSDGDLLQRDGGNARGASIVPGTPNLEVDNDPGQITLTVKQTVALAGVEVGTRRRLNLIQGTNVTLTVTDNPGSDRIDATFAASGGGPSEVPSGFSFTANAATLDVSAARNFAQTSTLTGNSTITLTNGVDGSWGTILVKQDGTGSRTLAFTVSGRTVMRDLAVPDTNPFPAANSVTMYQYYYVTVNSVALVVINKIPIAA